MVHLPNRSWDTWLVWLSFTLLGLAILFGIAGGAAIGMYYDLLPDAGAREDGLTPIQLILFLGAFLLGMPYVVLGLQDVRSGLWRQGARRFLPAVGPLVVIVATEALSHLLWWEPISHSDRFHMLHHSLVAGLPVFALYWLSLRRWWRPESFHPVPTLQARTLFLSGLALLILLSMFVGFLMGAPELTVIMVVAALLISLLVPIAHRRLRPTDMR